QAAPPRDRDNATAPPPPGGDDQPEELIAYVRTEASDAIAQAPAGVTTISARHTHAPVPVRAPVTSERSGPLRPLSEGVAHDGGQHSLDRREGTLDTSRGNRAVATILPQPVSAGGGGGGARGRGRSAGGAGAAGPRLEGGQAAAAASGASAAAGGGGAGIGPQPRAAQPAPLGTRPTPDAPGWWRPLAARVVEPRRPAPATQAASVAPATTRGVRRAVIERPGQRADLGGADTTPERGALPDPIAPAPGLGHPIAAPGTADPVEELREALGFGPVDREQLSARPAWAGPDGAHGRSDSSPQAVADVPIAWTTAVSTIGTPLGAWIQRCEALIAQRWRSRDLDPHARALGLQGQVTVRYVIQGTGRVSEAKVTRSSGNANLDQMALDAIPAKLPRLPRGLRSVPLHHQITLRYRNPLVTTGSEP
ncbi:MAG TPA: TonB family protein, partial [Deltaproteobacteria bacterium]|nr:TonB family protein [Deltaproteobacteria bacterium]